MQLIFLESETSHSTHNFKNKEELMDQLKYDPYIRDLIKRIYYFDYLLFKYDINELN